MGLQINNATGTSDALADLYVVPAMSSTAQTICFWASGAAAAQGDMFTLDADGDTGVSLEVPGASWAQYCQPFATLNGGASVAPAGVTFIEWVVPAGDSLTIADITYQ
jgi:hypothetical protein